MSLHCSEPSSDPFLLRCNHCLWLPRGLSRLITCLAPWSPYLSWNVPHPLLPLPFADAVLLGCCSFQTLRIHSSLSSGLCSASPSLTAACKITSPPYAPNQRALSIPLILLFSIAPSPSNIYICLSVVCLVPSFLPPLPPNVNFTKAETWFYSLLRPQTLEEYLTQREGTHEIFHNLVNKWMNDWMDGWPK